MEIALPSLVEWRSLEGRRGDTHRSASQQVCRTEVSALATHHSLKPVSACAVQLEAARLGSAVSPCVCVCSRGTLSRRACSLAFPLPVCLPSLSALSFASCPAVLVSALLACSARRQSLSVCALQHAQTEDTSTGAQQRAANRGTGQRQAGRQSRSDGEGRRQQEQEAH